MIKENNETFCSPDNEQVYALISCFREKKSVEKFDVCIIFDYEIRTRSLKYNFMCVCMLMPKFICLFVWVCLFFGGFYILSVRTFCPSLWVEKKASPFVSFTNLFCCRDANERRDRECVRERDRERTQPIP